MPVSEEQYRLLFENNPQPMWVYDLETLAFLLVNDAAIHHYGYSREEFLSMTIRDIRPPEDVPLLLDHMSKPAPKYQISGPWRHRKKDGSLIEVEVSSHELVLGGRPARLVLVHDITERRRAEEERIRLLAREREARIAAELAQQRLAFLVEASAPCYPLPSTTKRLCGASRNSRFPAWRTGVQLTSSKRINT